MKRNEMIEKIFLTRGEELDLGEKTKELFDEALKTSETFLDAIKENKDLKDLYYDMHFAECAFWGDENNRYFCEGIRWGVRLLLDILCEKV